MNHPLYPNNDLRKKIEDYSYGLKDVIGRGFSSVVYRGTNDKTKEKVAVKVIDIRAIQGKPEKKMLDGEIQALKKLNHPNIMKCHDIFSTANNCYIITEFCNEGDLQNLLKKRDKLPEEEALPLIREILMGFMAIADAGFLHRDLKPANILLKDKSVRIADFGFAKRVTSSSKETVNVGSPLYMSPEALQSNVYTIKNDIWSMGVILYEILHGKAPWVCANEKQLIEQINKNSISMLKNLAEDLKDFIRRCLTTDERKRITIKEIANHPFYCRAVAEAEPVLLRKITSNNENTDVGSAPLIESYGSKPKILHHRQPNAASSCTLEKQFMNQVNWMRFLCRYSQMFPEVSESGRYTLGLRFIVVKQMLSQLQALEMSLSGQNIFSIEGWSDFIANQEQCQKYVAYVEQYKIKYEAYLKQIKEWSPFVSKDKKLTSFVDVNFQRSERLAMQGVAYAVQECRNIWQSLVGQKNSGLQGELQGKTQVEAQRLDFTMSYFQLNGFLLDNFHDPQYFTRNSKLQIINECRPAVLSYCNLKDLQYKLISLELVK